MFSYLEEMISDGISRGIFPGAVVCFCNGSQFLKAYGNRMIVPRKLPMVVDTLFDMASLTKPLATAPSIMLLRDRGEIDLSRDLAYYLPQFKRKGITIFHLLTHTSGLPAWKPLYLEAKDEGEVIEYLSDLPLEYETGSKVIYSCLGYILLGELIRKLSGMELDRFADQNIFAPLGMNDTFFNPPESRREQCAATEDSSSAEKRMTNYRSYRWRKGVVVGEVHDENSHFLGGVAGNAGLFSRASDVAKFCRMIMNDGENVLSCESVWMMTTNQTPGLDASRTIGWIALENKIYHTGFTGTSIEIDLKNRAVAILLTNRVHPDATKEGIIEFRQEFYRKWHFSLAAASNKV